jgi:protein-tyrosine phosphatase
MKGYIDLHCHYLPAVDDGVRTADEGIALLAALHAAGFSRVVATPHIRTAVFDNRAAALRASFDAFVSGPLRAATGPLPETGLSAEHFFDDVFWELFERGETLPYPGGHCALLEFHQDVLPRVEERFFAMRRRGVTPVIAHPERYAPLYRRTDPIERWLEMGALPLLDLMALVGKYGEAPRRAAERMLHEGVYWAACSDCHRPSDVPVVAAAIARLRVLIGSEEADELLVAGPQSILDGTADP